VIDRLIKALTPFWLVGIGALLGLLVLLLLWGLLAVVHRPTARLMREIVGEKLVWPVLLLAVGLAVFSIAITAYDVLGGRFYDQKAVAIRSVFRMPFVGSRALDVHVFADATKLEVPLNIRAGELSELRLTSDNAVTVGINVPPSEALTSDDRFELTGEPANWVRGRDPRGPLAGEVRALYVTNDAGKPAKLSINLTTEIRVPEARLMPYTALGLVAYVAAYLLLQMLLPRVAAVALTTGKEAVSQPLFYLTMIAGLVVLFFLMITPYFTFGEDIKMYKETGLKLILILSVILALWTASVSVAEEIEGRTALTVLSKPISRHQFVLGKYAGIVGAVGLQFILLGIPFLLFVSYKVPFDARESAKAFVPWQECYIEVVRTVPGLVLAFLETIVLAAISVAISTRLPWLANLIICLAIYVVGHLVPLFVQSAVGEFAIVQFMGQLFATILPVLEYFDIYAAVAAGRDVPLNYLGWVMGYAFTYIAIAMLAALALFDDRDLA
jgi:ABC-type transport system involved in multi-copper enzyme maturation permease subunit